MSHTLIITNDFPPRPGGIQTFIYELARRFEPGTVTVLTSRWDEFQEFDDTLAFRVVRADTQVLLPTKKTYELARDIIVESRVTSVLFGAAAPLALMAPKLRALGVKHIVGITHGHEAGWAITPVTRQLLHRIGDSVDVLTYLGSYTRQAIGAVLSQQARSSMRQLTPGVDPEIFHPRNNENAKALRQSIGYADRPVVVCVSRLMERKGQDTLIRLWPQIQQSIPNAALVIVGEGKWRNRLDALVRDLGLENDVHFAGKVSYDQLPFWYAVGDVFAMPCRTRMGGWDVEGLGIVYLEASATGIPVIAGNSGGAPDAVVDGKTGFVVDGRDDQDVVQAIVELLSDQDLRQELGTAGRQWVLDKWTWEREVSRVQSLLCGDDPDA